MLIIIIVIIVIIVITVITVITVIIIIIIIISSSSRGRRISSIHAMPPAGLQSCTQFYRKESWKTVGRKKKTILHVLIFAFLVVRAISSIAKQKVSDDEDDDEQSQTPHFA